MTDRYFNHIVGCLEASIKTAEDGVDCHLPAVTAQGAVDLLKEQQERIERLQPKKGKWLEYAGDQKCSVCGSCYSDLHPEYSRTPFCPHCGAKMEEGDGE